MTAPTAFTARRTLQARLSALGYVDYIAYLRSRHWALIRRQYRTDDTCPQTCICGATENLQLHHRTYERLGEEANSDLYPLCPECHAMLHRCIRNGLLAADASPTELVNPDQAERDALAIAAARDIAAREAIASTPLHLADRSMVRDLHARIRAIKRGRERAKKRRAFQAGAAARAEDHATESDLAAPRVFEP